MNAGKVELLDLQRLSAQLVRLERRVARGGKDSVDHAPGAHDDMANAAAGALVLARVRGERAAMRWPDKDEEPSEAMQAVLAQY